MVGMLIALTHGSYKQREVMLIYIAMFGTYHLVFDSLANIKNPSGRKKECVQKSVQLQHLILVVKTVTKYFITLIEYGNELLWFKSTINHLQQIML